MKEHLGIKITEIPHPKHPGANPGFGKPTIKSVEKLKPFLDPEIEEVVLFLIENNFSTNSSCSGLDGHAFPVPTIRMCVHYTSKPDSTVEDLLRKERHRLAELLQTTGYIGYDLKEIYNNSWCCLELGFWDIEYVVPHEYVEVDGVMKQVPIRKLEK